MSVTPDFIGQVYKDTATGNIWRANSTTPGDWTLEVQNVGIAWEPTSVPINTVIGYQMEEGEDGITRLVISATTTVHQIIITSQTLQYLSFPNLVSVDPDYNWGSDFSVADCPLLTTLLLPMFQKNGSGKLIISLTGLSSISLPAFVSAGDDIQVDTNASLTSFSAPLLVPKNGKDLFFQNNALDQTSVDGILARAVANAAYISGTIALNGGTNSSPSASGLANKATLQGRGCNVQTN